MKKSGSIFQRRIFVAFKRNVRKILSQKSTPHSIALGVAIGVGIGMTPTIPFQMLLAFSIAWAFRANRACALIPVWITNPLTVVPVYYFNYRVGKFAVMSDPISYETFSGFFKGNGGFPYNIIYGIGNALQGWLENWTQILLALIIGSLVVGLISGLITYPVTLRLVVWWKNHKEKKRKKWLLRMKTQQNQV